MRAPRPLDWKRVLSTSLCEHAPLARDALARLVVAYRTDGHRTPGAHCGVRQVRSPHTLGAVNRWLLDMCLGKSYTERREKARIRMSTRGPADQRGEPVGGSSLGRAPRGSDLRARGMTA